LAENFRIFGYFYFTAGVAIPRMRGPDFIVIDTAINK
jgi:hypothetical protein